MKPLDPKKAYWFVLGTTTVNREMKIYDAMPATDETLLSNYRQQHGEPVPGTVIYGKKGTLAVMCQDAPLLLLEIQPASGKRMKAADCAHNFEVGAKMEDEE